MTQPHSCLAPTCWGFFIAASVWEAAACCRVCDTPTSWPWATPSGSAMPFCFSRLCPTCGCALISLPFALSAGSPWRCLSAQASCTSGRNGASALRGGLRFAFCLRKINLLQLICISLRCNASLLIRNWSRGRKAVISCNKTEYFKQQISWQVSFVLNQ